VRRAPVAALALLQLAFAAVPRGATAAARPTTVNLFSDSANDVEVVLDNVTYNSTGTCPSGSGSISELHLFGHDLTAAAAAAPAVPFRNMCFDAAGNVSGVSITLNAAFTTDSVFNGIGLTFGSGTTLTVLAGSNTATSSTAGAQSCATQYCLSFSGSITLALPLRDAQGNQAQAQLTNTTLLLQQGKFVLNAPHMQLKNALSDGKASLGGFAFTVSDISLQVERTNGQTRQFLLTVQQPQVDVPLPIPGLLSQDGKGITVKADSLAINQSGELQIKNGVATANCAAGATATCGIQVDLASPLGFTLKTTQVKFSKPFDSTDTSVSGQFRLSNTQLLLPDILPDADAPASAASTRIALAVQSESNGDWDPTHSPVAKITIPRDIDIGWNGFKVQVPQGTAAVVDFSGTAGDPTEPTALGTTWQGVYIKSAKLLLPPLFGQCPGGAQDCAIASEGPVAVAATDLSIGSGGVSVGVNVSSPTQIHIAGFNAVLRDVALAIANNHVDAKNMKIDASVSLPALGNTNWGMQFTDSGSFVLSLQNASLDPPFFGGSDIAGIHLDLTGATLALPAIKGDPGSVNLSGLLTFKAGTTGSELAASLGGLTIPFKDLGIDTSGKFILPAAGQFTLPHPVSVDLKVMKLEMTSFTAGNDSATNKPYLLFTGGVDVGEGLPVSADVDFDGLEVQTDGKVKMHGLEVKADVAGVLRFDASLQHLDAGTMNWNAGSRADGCWQARSKAVGCIKGTMKLGLNLGGLSLGQGQDGFSFIAAQGAWLFVGAMGIPGPGIVLGQSGLSLYRFSGGVGYKNVLADPSDQVSASAQIGDPKYIIYLDPNAPGDDLLFSIGTGLGTSDSGFNFYADAVATLTTDPFKLDFNARAKFQELMSTSFESASRAAYMDIQYSAPDTLHATASADIYYESRSLDLVDAHGALDLLVSPSETHLFLGWPPDKNPITVNVGISGIEKFTFSGGLGVHIIGSQLDIDHDPSNTSNTGPWFAADLNWHGEIGPLSADVGGFADISLYTNPSTHSVGIASAVGSVYARGQADFGPFSASAEGSLALAYVAAGNQVTLLDPDGTPKQVSAGNSGVIYVDGEVEGCGSVLGGSICKSIDVSDTL
jgi:hypothetical protein